MKKTAALLLLALILTACNTPAPTQPPVQSALPLTPEEITEPATPETPDEPALEPEAEDSALHLSSLDTEPPVINGRLDEGEWVQAQQAFLSDGAPVYGMYIDGHLYVAIEESAVGAVNLVILREPDQLWILHASAALGSMIYEKDGDTWSKVQDFEWCCRSFTDTSSINALYEAEGWRSRITSAGVPGQVEYQVRLEPGEYTVAIMFLLADNSGNFAFFPDTLSEEAYTQIMGPFDQQIPFKLSEWSKFLIEQ